MNSIPSNIRWNRLVLQHKQKEGTVCVEITNYTCIKDNSKLNLILFVIHLHLVSINHQTPKILSLSRYK